MLDFSYDDSLGKIDDNELSESSYANKFLNKKDSSKMDNSELVNSDSKDFQKHEKINKSSSKLHPLPSQSDHQDYKDEFERASSDSKL